MTDTISSVKSYWRGSPSVLLTDPATGKTAPANATTNQNDWGNTISAKSDEKDNSSTPWIELTLPADTDFPQHNVACHIDLNIEYPHMAGVSTFEVLKQHMNRDLTLHLAPPGAGTATPPPGGSPPSPPPPPSSSPPSSSSLTPTATADKPNPPTSSPSNPPPPNPPHPPPTPNPPPKKTIPILILIFILILILILISIPPQSPPLFPFSIFHSLPLTPPLNVRTMFG